jgi:hypothetical protein
MTLPPSLVLDSAYTAACRAISNALCNRSDLVVSSFLLLEVKKFSPAISIRSSSPRSAIKSGESDFHCFRITRFHIPGHNGTTG